MENNNNIISGFSVSLIVMGVCLLVSFLATKFLKNNRNLLIGILVTGLTSFLVFYIVSSPKPQPSPGPVPGPSPSPAPAPKINCSSLANEETCTANNCYWNNKKCSELPKPGPTPSEYELPGVSLGTLQTSVPNLETFDSPWQPAPNKKVNPSKSTYSPISYSANSGKPVDWFFAYKLPGSQGSLYIDSNGTSFTYEKYEKDANTIWQRSIAATMNQIIQAAQSEDGGYAIWNDAPGEQGSADHIFSQNSDQLAHEKGAFCYNQQGGWILQHTQDHWPRKGVFDIKTTPPTFQKYIEAPTYNPYAETYFCCSFQNSDELPDKSKFDYWGGILGQVSGLEILIGSARLSPQTPKNTPLYNWLNSLTYSNNTKSTDKKAYVDQSGKSAWLYRAPVSVVTWPYTQKGQQIMLCAKNSYWFRSHWYDLFMSAVSCNVKKSVDYQLQDWWRTFQSPTYCKGEIPPDNWRANWFPFKRGQPLPMSMTHALQLGYESNDWFTYVDHGKWMVPTKEFRDQGINWVGFSGLNHTGAPCPGSFSDLGEFCPHDWYYLNGCQELRNGGYCVNHPDNCFDHSGKNLSSTKPNYKTKSQPFDWSLDTKAPDKPSTIPGKTYYTSRGEIYTAGGKDTDCSARSATSPQCVSENKNPIYPGNYGANCSQWFRGGYIISINSSILANLLGDLIKTDCGCDGSDDPKQILGWNKDNSHSPSNWKWDYKTMNNSPDDVEKLYQLRTCHGIDCKTSFEGCMSTVNSQGIINMTCNPFIPTETGGVGTASAKYRLMGPSSNNYLGNPGASPWWDYNVPPCWNTLQNGTAQNIMDDEKKIKYQSDYGKCSDFWDGVGVTETPDRDPLKYIKYYCPEQ